MYEPKSYGRILAMRMKEPKNLKSYGYLPMPMKDTTRRQNSYITILRGQYHAYE